MSKRTSQRAPAVPEPATGPAAPADNATLPGLAPDTSAAFPPGAGAGDRIRAVLAAAPPEGLTADRIAETAQVARSTVSKVLIALTRTDGARREVGGFIGRSRQPDHWHPADADPRDQTAPDTATEDPGPGDSAPAPANTSAPSPAVTTNSLAGNMAPATDTDGTPGSGPGTGAGAEADSAPDAGPDGPAAPDTPTPPDGAASGPDTAAVAPAVPAPATVPNPAPEPGTPVRLGAGALRQLVFEHLNTHPAQAFTPGEIGRAIGGRSSGAVANACDKLTADGLVELACEKPRRFRAPGPTSGTGADAEQPREH
ncbi:hypothetical protein OG216_34815 [Streptomycetaceae bacterium NBC_01309]